jgi:hypothetical protein
MRNSRSGAILNLQAPVLRVVGLGFDTTPGVVMMTWARAKSRSSRPADHDERTVATAWDRGFALPAMALINDVAYRTAYRKLAPGT